MSSEAHEGVLKISEETSNKACADCKRPSVSAVSFPHGVFVCSVCAVSHKKLTFDVRFLEDSKAWDDTILLKLASKGTNASVNGILEANLPPFYHRPWPSPDCPEIIRNVFIEAKYIRKEFTADEEVSKLRADYSLPDKVGWLQKRPKDSTNFIDRLFRLSVNGCVLKYFAKESDNEPRGTADLERINLSFVNSSEYDLPFTTLIIQDDDRSSIRLWFIKSDCPRTIVSWYNALRFGKYHRLCLSLSGMGKSIIPAEVASQLTFPILKCGWLSKTGPNPGDSWRSRWCILKHKLLLYSDNKTSQQQNGSIFIGSSSEGYSVMTGVSEKVKKTPWYSFSLITPGRVYAFSAKIESDRDAWIMELQKIIGIESQNHDREQRFCSAISS